MQSGRLSFAMETIVIGIRAVIAALGIAAALPAFAQQSETFTEIRPGDISVDPANLIEGANRGDVRALNNLGLLWARGVGLPAPNYEEAMRFWKEAARRGYTVSMNNLGLLYANGQGVKQSYEEAQKWWELSAENGDAWAMNSLGDLYENGQGVEQSYPLALDWYRKAAEGGDPLGMYNLGHFYEEGLGLERDYRAALTWYERSADRGTGVAMFRIGRMIAEGRGVPADPAEGYAWLEVAKKYFTGEDAAEAEQNAKALAAMQLTPVQAQRAKEIASNLEARIEERRKAQPLRAGPGESET